MAPVFFSKSDDFGTKSNRKEDFKMLQTQKEGYQTICMPSPANFAKDDKESLHGTWKNTSGISEKQWQNNFHLEKLEYLDDIFNQEVSKDLHGDICKLI